MFGEVNLCPRLQQTLYSNVAFTCDSSGFFSFSELKFAATLWSTPDLKCDGPPVPPPRTSCGALSERLLSELGEPCSPRRWGSGAPRRACHRETSRSVGVRLGAAGLSDPFASPITAGGGEGSLARSLLVAPHVFCLRMLRRL